MFENRPTADNANITWSVLCLWCISVHMNSVWFTVKYNIYKYRQNMRIKNQHDYIK